VLSAFPINKKNKGFRDMKNIMKKEVKTLTMLTLTNGDMLLINEPLDLDGFARETKKLNSIKHREARIKRFEAITKLFAEEIAFSYRLNSGEFTGKRGSYEY
jgi:hypothetical protein